MTYLNQIRTRGIAVHSLKTTLLLLVCSIMTSVFVLHFWTPPFILTRWLLPQTPAVQTEITSSIIHPSQIKRQLKSASNAILMIQMPSTPETALKSHIPPETQNMSIACQFPKQNPFDPLVMKHFRKHEDIDCSGGLPSLVYLEGNYLRVNWTKASLKNISLNHCNYRTFTLGNSDNMMKGTRPKSFHNLTEIGGEHENILVKCFLRSNLVSKSYFIRIVKNGFTEKICAENYNRHIKQNFPLETLNVLLVGIDGTSRQNLIRAMPRTRNFILNNMGATEFYKFNKVGENTWPNILPLVTGLHVEELKKQNWNESIPFDSFDHLFVWHDYKQAGYRTAMMLDHGYWTPFHYLKKGWTKPPFDFYPRPMILQRHKRVQNKDCVADIPETTFLLDYWLQLTTTFNNTRTKPYFAFSFNIRITHDYPNKATCADKIYFNFFRNLVDRKVLNNTVVVFFADHGGRFGPIRLVKPGMFETNTPFLFLTFPPWFHTKYPHLISTLRTNQHRLTTSFDLHATLKDLLYFDGKTGKGNLKSRGISFFKEIPRDRQCQHAGIPADFCMCSPNTTMSPGLSKRLADCLLEGVNNKTASHRDICEIFTISKIYYVFQITINTQCDTCSYFRVTIDVTPGGRRIIEGVLELDTTLDTIRVVTMQKLKRHGKRSRCLIDKEINPYCYCNTQN